MATLCNVIFPDIASPEDAVCAVVALVINVPGAAGIVVVLGKAPTSAAVYVGLLDAFAHEDTSEAGSVVG